MVEIKKYKLKFQESRQIFKIKAKIFFLFLKINSKDNVENFDDDDE